MIATEKKIHPPLILLLILFLIPLSTAPTLVGVLTVKNPAGSSVVYDTMSCIPQGYQTGVSFDSPTVCGTNTTTPNLINRTSTSCTYNFAKTYTMEGNWTAYTYFYYLYYENKGVGIITTPPSYIDTASPPSGQIAGDCTGNLTCTSDPYCNFTQSYESAGPITLYNISWDARQTDCEGYGKAWYSQVNGTIPQNCTSAKCCCGDDGANDNFYSWGYESPTNCRYCNAGVSTAATTKCPAGSSNCTGYGSSTCHSGDENYCCYNVGCSSTGATGSETNMVGGNCTCTDGLCAWMDFGNGYCMNGSWGGAGCYSGVSCTSNGWGYSTLDSPPKDVTGATISPQLANPETTINVTGNVTDYAPVTGALRLEVYFPLTSSPDGSTLCTGNSVASGSNSSCTFTASSAGCSPGNCTVKIIAYEVDNDGCGHHKYSFNFVNLSFRYGTRNLSTPVLNAPTSDPEVTVGNSFVLNCTPITGNASTGINMSFQFNSTTSNWANISTSGGLITSQTNPVVNVLNATAYAINVTANQAGTYWVRCQVYNSTYAANSTAQSVTVTAIPTSLSQSASPPSPQYYGTNITFSCNYSLQEDGSPITEATVYVNINGTDFSTTYDASSGNYTYWNNTLSGGDTSWYCKANKTGYDSQTGSTQTYTITAPTISTTLTTYPNCGAVFYRVSLYDAGSKLINSHFSLKIIDPTTTVLSQAALYPNNGTGVYISSYSLDANSQLGTWLLKITADSGVSTGKNFYVITNCGDEVCAGGENYGNCPADCISYCGDEYCNDANEDCHNCAADCGCAGSTTCCDCGTVCGVSTFYSCAPFGHCDAIGCGCTP